MLNNEQLAGFMMTVYTGIEAMNKEQRRIVLKHIKDAMKMSNFNYPNGKPRLITPTEVETNEILRPNP